MRSRLLGVSLLFLASGCQTDHGKNCEDLCEALVECSYERVCQYVVDKDVNACRKNCAKTDGTFDMECTACLAADFTCEEPVGEECVEACGSADFVGPVWDDELGGHPPGEWFCDGEPLVPNR